ncbi:PspC domain-containing protein [Runella salmonicolor]|uniref:PspC domain-containing protein n=1 Tax=Runella salmonicolor TaxID=2950278 RepID=A0ABT1FUE0_9BACT|nr:PspC domain-containing protein [Runella salmonicolor]MCP1385354.1 PspC domain-containing protein [Runella salmonicolor]
MKKTISINIAGLIFYIEEDGYDKLRNYLNSIQKYFSSYEDSKEIISDIEGRIAEKFLNRQKAADTQVIALEDVEELIKSMGTVADFEAIEEEEDLAAQTAASSQQAASFSQASAGNPEPAAPKSAPSAHTTPRKLVRDTKRKLLGGVCAGIAHHFNVDPLFVRLLFLLFFLGLPAISGGVFGGDSAEFFGPLSGFTFLLYVACWVSFPGSDALEEDKNIKKFYRNPDQKVVGGVAAGVAAYFGVDLGVVRFIWVLSILFFGTGLLLYIVLWLITPKANTLTEKMEMKGQPITLENIETNVKKALQPEQKEENIATKLLLFPFRAVAMVFSGLTPLMKFLVVIMRIFAGLIMFIIGAGALLGLVTALFAVFGLGTWDFGQIDNELMPLNFFIGEVSPVAYIFAFLAIGVPFATLAWLGISLLTKENKFTPAVWQTLLGLFLAGLLGSTIFGFQYGANFRREGTVEKEQTYKLPATPILLDVHEENSEDGYNNTQLDLEGYESTDAKVAFRFRSQGRSRQDAERNASNILYNINQTDSTLVFDEDFSLSDKSPRFRGQSVRLTLYFPYAKTFRMTRDFYDHFWGVRNQIQYEYDLDINEEMFKNIRWAIKPDSGLVCLDRPISVREESRNNDDSDDMDEISDGIESGLNEAFDRSFDAKGEMVKQFDVTNFSKVRIGGAFVVTIQKGDVYKVVADGRETDLDDVEVKVEDGTLRVENRRKVKLFERNKRVGITITVPTIEAIDLSGATLGKITGFNNLGTLKVEISGASKTYIDVNAKKLELDVAGASKVELHGSANTLEADLAGACSLDAERMNIQNGDVQASGVSKANLGRIPNLKSNSTGASRIHQQGEGE